MKNLLLTFFAMIFLSACANTGSSLAEKNLQIQKFVNDSQIENVDKVTSFRFQGWNSLTDNFLIISSSPKKQYLIELTGLCNDIRWAHAIILHRSTNSILHAKFDSISTVSEPRIKCRIGKIYPITHEQEDVIKAIKNPPEEDEKQEAVKENT